MRLPRLPYRLIFDRVYLACLLAAFSYVSYLIVS